MTNHLNLNAGGPAFITCCNGKMEIGVLNDVVYVHNIESEPVSIELRFSGVSVQELEAIGKMFLDAANSQCSIKVEPGAYHVQCSYYEDHKYDHKIKSFDNQFHVCTICGSKATFTKFS